MPIFLLTAALFAPTSLWAASTHAGTALRHSEDAVRKSPAEGRVASVSMMTQAADMVAGHGMNKLLDAALVAMVNKNTPYGVGGFGAVTGGGSTYHTASQTGGQVDVRGYSLITGLGKRFDASWSNVLVGAFFETGSGSYNSYSDGNSSTIMGWGNSQYFGGGMLGRVEFTSTALAGFYTEASVRMGGLHTTYNSDDLHPAYGRASYNTDATYYGIHAGLGYTLWAFADGVFDFYSKYFLGHTTANDMTIMGSAVSFDTVNSHRIRTGTRFSFCPTRELSPYAEAAWEYEFDGKVRSNVDGQSISAPSLRGSTGVGALGIVWKPLGYSIFSIDLGVQGHVGVRKGLGGILQLQVEF